MYLIACLRSDTDLDFKREAKRQKESKRAQLKALEENEQQIIEEMSKKENKSSTAKLLAKILDNFQLRVNRIHLRLEYQDVSRSLLFTAGIILEKLYVYSDRDETEEGVSTSPTPSSSTSSLLLPSSLSSSASSSSSSSDILFNKKLKITKLGLYWDDNAAFINTDSAESFHTAMIAPFLDSVPTKFQSILPRDYLLQPISAELNLLLDLRKVEQRRPSVEKAISLALSEFQLSKEMEDAAKRCFQFCMKNESTQEACKAAFLTRFSSKFSDLVSSESSKRMDQFFTRCWEIKHTAKAAVQIDGNLDSFSFILQHHQFVSITEFISSLSFLSLREHYRQFRPAHSDVEKYPREWWKFAIQSVMWNNRSQSRYRSWRELRSYKAKRDEYVSLYKRKLGVKPSLKKDAKGLMRLRKLEDLLSLQEIMIFRRIAMSQVAEETEKKKKSLYSLRKSPSPRPEDQPKKLKMMKTKTKKEEEEDLWSGFDIDPNDSPWEGEMTQDIQFWLDFKIHKISLDLTRDEKKLFSVVLKNAGIRVVNRKEILQLWCSLQNVSLKYLRNAESPWNKILYPEKGAILDFQKSVVFLPREMCRKQETPFLQLFAEIPSASSDQILRFRCSTLPLCLVANLNCITDVVAFFSDSLSSLHLEGFSTQEWRLLSPPKRRQVRIAHEISSYRRNAVDVYVGPIHILLPEDLSCNLETRETLVVRLGDMAITNAESTDHDLDVNRFEVFNVRVGSISVLLTDGCENWMVPEVQEEKQLKLLHDFQLNASVGVCITPSEVSLSNVEVKATLSMLRFQLHRVHYLALLQWATGFEVQLEHLVAHLAPQLIHLSHSAQRFVEWLWIDDRMKTDDQEGTSAQPPAQIEPVCILVDCLMLRKRSATTRKSSLFFL